MVSGLDRDDDTRPATCRAGRRTPRTSRCDEVPAGASQGGPPIGQNLMRIVRRGAIGGVG